ncbi:glycosyltransferase [Streptomyces uncialis]|uniref:glycosyltransferase n=1 Tax=Streptomyces uncialis TaxID=1048205 RepID=UPI003659EB35
MTASAPEPGHLDVFGWRADDHGCGAYRVRFPFEGLAGLGHTVEHSTRLPAHVREDATTVVVGQRVCKPGPSELWQALAQQGRRLVYELDDDLFSVDASSPLAHDFYSQPDIRANIRRNIEVAAAVTVTTEPLAELVARWNPNVHIVPNAVPDWLVDHTPPVRDDGTVTIGWGGSATHDMDFDQVRGPLGQFLRRRPSAVLHCIGVDYTRGLRLRPAQARYTPWIARTENFLTAIDYHVAIAPLRPHVFNQSKSALKALEAGALGIPVVASAVRPYEDYVRHGETGYLVRRDHEWGRYLRALTEDPGLRAAMGAAGREQARAHTVSAVAPLWQKAIFE